MGVEHLLYRNLKQPIVFWEYDGVDTYGNKQYKTSVQIYGRVESLTELKNNDDAEMFLPDSKVFLLQDVSENSYLYLGKKEDVSTITQPAQLVGAYRVVSFSKIPALSSCVDFLRIAYLTINIL